MDRESIKREIIRCGRDPIYFIRTYAKIRHPVRGLLPFNVFDYQEQLVRDFNDHRFNVILKARQLGISEISAAYAAWLILFHRHKTVLVMATKLPTAKNMIKKTQLIIKKLPKWLMLADYDKDNVMSIELTNGSSMKAITTSEDAGRSEALSLLIIDEAAFVRNLTELWTGLYPTISTGGRAIIISTPNGVGNWFHETCSDAEAKLNDFKFTKLMWWRHPERVEGLRDDPDRPGFKTSDWLVNEIKNTNMSERDVAQELECEFLSSGHTVISARNIMDIMKECPDPVSRENDQLLHVWASPKPGVKYLLAADVARGDGKDYSAFHIFDAQNMEQVAEFQGKLPTDLFAKVICEWGTKYNNALAVVENNNIGSACLEHIKIIGYPNLYFSKKKDPLGGEAVNTAYAPLEDVVAGFSTNQKNRGPMIDKFEEYVRNRQINVKSKRLVNEMKTFIWNGGRPEAAKNCNDDLFMAGAIAVWIRENFLANQMGNSESISAMLNSISINKTDNTNIEGASKDPRFQSGRELGPFVKENPGNLVVRMPNGLSLDFSWLMKG